MTTVPQGLSVVALVCLAIGGCASGRSYGVSYMTWAATLTLNEDGSFNYGSQSDEIGSDCHAQGKWIRDRRGGDWYVFLTIDSVREDSEDACKHFTQEKQWMENRDRLIPVNGEPLRRQSKE